MSRPAQTRIAGLRRRVAEERGMTIVEAVVAALVLVIMSLGVLQVVDASTRNTYRAEQSQVVVNRLQAELEEVQKLGYDEVALRLPVPSHDPDPATPNWRISDADRSFALRRDGGDSAPLVYEGSGLEDGGQVGDPVPAAVEHRGEPFQSGDVKGQIYRYVVWINDDACGEERCPGDQDLKRVVVVAALDDTASGGTRAYQELHTDIVDPNTVPVDNPAPDGEEIVTRPATFWLTDTPCGGDDRPQPTERDHHPTHNTHGTCGDEQLFDPPGPPDLMFAEQPFMDGEEGEEGDEAATEPLDYSTDISEDPVASPDPGLRMRPPGSAGCLLPGEGGFDDENQQTKLHVWLSPPMPAGYVLDLTGEATLELSISTVDELSTGGTICVWLFKRPAIDAQPDVLIENVDPPDPGAAYYHGEFDSPSPEQWTEVPVPMSFPAQSVAPGERLGLAIAVEGSTGKDLEFLYDHPQFPSRLAVRTTSPLDPLLGG